MPVVIVIPYELARGLGGMEGSQVIPSTDGPLLRVAVWCVMAAAALVLSASARAWFREVPSRNMRPWYRRSLNILAVVPIVVCAYALIQGNEHVQRVSISVSALTMTAYLRYLRSQGRE